MYEECRAVPRRLMPRCDGKLQRIDALVPISVLVSDVLGDHCFDGSVRSLHGITMRSVNGRGPVFDTERGQRNWREVNWVVLSGMNWSGHTCR